LEQQTKKNYRKKSLPSKRGRRPGWIIGVTAASFVLSGGLLYASSTALDGASIFAAIAIVLVIVIVGIVFDTVGISVAAAKISVFHSMAAKKIYGAKQAIWLVNNADKVSTLIIFSIVGNMQKNPNSWPSLIVSGAVAALTVGGKAIGKVIALRHGNIIVQKSGALLRFFLGKRKSINVN